MSPPRMRTRTRPRRRNPASPRAHVAVGSCPAVQAARWNSRRASARACERRSASRLRNPRRLERLARHLRVEQPQQSGFLAIERTARRADLQPSAAFHRSSSLRAETKRSPRPPLASSFHPQLCAAARARSTHSSSSSPRIQACAVRPMAPARPVAVEDGDRLVLPSPSAFNEGSHGRAASPALSSGSQTSLARPPRSPNRPRGSPLLSTPTTSPRLVAAPALVPPRSAPAADAPTHTASSSKHSHPTPSLADLPLEPAAPIRVLPTHPATLPYMWDSTASTTDEADTELDSTFDGEAGAGAALLAERRRREEAKVARRRVKHDAPSGRSRAAAQAPAHVPGRASLDTAAAVTHAMQLKGQMPLVEGRRGLGLAFSDKDGVNEYCASRSLTSLVISVGCRGAAVRAAADEPHLQPRPSLAAPLARDPTPAPPGVRQRASPSPRTLQSRSRPTRRRARRAECGSSSRTVRPVVSDRAAAAPSPCSPSTSSSRTPSRCHLRPPCR